MNLYGFGDAHGLKPHKLMWRGDSRGLKPYKTKNIVYIDLNLLSLHGLVTSTV
jgi:hypothetical protein